MRAYFDRLLAFIGILRPPQSVKVDNALRLNRKQNIHNSRELSREPPLNFPQALVGHTALLHEQVFERERGEQREVFGGPAVQLEDAQRLSDD